MGGLPAVAHLTSSLHSAPKHPHSAENDKRLEAGPCIWRPASSSLMHPLRRPFVRSQCFRHDFLCCTAHPLLFTTTTPFFHQRAFSSAASRVHLFDRALLISFVAFAFVRSIAAASSPLSTFATPQATPRNKHHSDTSSTCRRRREERSRVGRNRRSRHRTVLPPGNQHG
jgi:hypothetical protein